MAKMISSFKFQHICSSHVNIVFLMLVLLATLLVGTQAHADLIEQAILVASDADSFGDFGKSVSISGDYIVVGDRRADDEYGSAYVFKRDGTTWTQQAKLNASDMESVDWFGQSVSISGDYVIIGADDDNYKGSAYIFKRNGTSWTQQAKLIAPDGATRDWFGWSVSIN